jgi:hypothetical protein
MAITKEAGNFLEKVKTPSSNIGNPKIKASDVAIGVGSALALRGLAEIKNHYKNKLRTKLFDKKNYNPDESILQSRLMEAKTHPVRTGLKVFNTAALAAMLPSVLAGARHIHENKKLYENILMGHRK